jgi:dolichol-phosphate mannosyltransferase
MISVVIPCFNEGEVLRLTYCALTDAVHYWGEDVEILLVDDGSSDDTWAIIEDLAGRDSRVRGVRLSRNFGHQAAMGAGLERAGGEAVVVLDADLQDPPELVARMIALWKQGNDVVYARRNRRHGETWFKRATASLYYRLLGRLTQVRVPRDTGDFALMDARVVRTLLGFREHALFWRGLRSWAGFRQAEVTFDRPERAAGTTKYGLRKMLRLAGNGLVNFSDLPLQLPLYAGALALLLTLLAGVVSLTGGLFGLWPGGDVGPTALALFFLGSVQLLCLGLVGEYLNRIYEEVRGRPRWVVAETVGAEEAEPVRAPSRRRSA